MTATPVPTEVPWGLILGVVGGAFTVLGTILGILMRMLFKSVQKNTQDKFDHVQDRFDQVDEKVLQLSSRVDQYFKAHDRLRDKWEDFLREYLKIDSTRGQKIDALFRVVDEMQEKVREIRPALKSKIEEAFTSSLSELKLYVREQIDSMREDDDA